MAGSTRLSRETGGRRVGEKLTESNGEPTTARPVSIHCRVQSHPSRRGIRGRLLPGLAGMPVEIVETDFEPPNPWKGYLTCLDAPPEDCTHLLIVQDDTVTCRNLTPALEKIAQVEYEVPVCLYLGGLPMRTRSAALRAGKEGARFVDVHMGDFLPVVAILWPRQKALDFHAWGRDKLHGLRRRNGQVIEELSDDAMGGRWMRHTRPAQRVVATIPSLIEHPDDVISTIARKNTGRTALFWHGEEWDASTVDWS